MSDSSQNIRTLRIGLAGAGNICRSLHVPALLTLGHRIVFATDPSSAALSALRSQIPYSFESVVAPDLVLPSAPLDALLIASPPAAHAAQVILGLDAGLHVFCEKPIATRSTDAASLITHAAARGRVLQTGFFRRHHPSAREVARLITAGTFGRITGCRVMAGHEAKGLPASLLDPGLSGGGVVIDFGVHVFDRLLAWFDSLELTAYHDDFAGGMEANAQVLLLGAKNSQSFPIEIRMSRTSPLGYFTEIEFERATVRLPLNTGHEFTLTPRAEGARPLNVTCDEPREIIYYFMLQWMEFLDRINGSEKNTGSLADAVTASRLVEECYAARRPGTLVYGS